MKRTSTFGKAFIGKCIVFLFCVFFISMHNKIFGSENSIIAVVMLTGLLIYMKGDFGYNALQASGAIIFLFLIMSIAAKVALMNPFLGLVVNIVVISLMLILSCHSIEKGNHIPFLMGYLFCQGYDVEGGAFVRRVISMLVFGVITAVLYFINNHKKQYKRTVMDLFKEIDIHSVRTQWYIRMVITLSLTLFAANVLNYPRAMWIGLPVLSLTTPFEDEHYARSRARIPAAVIGTLLFYILFVVIIPEQFQTPIVLCAGFAAMFIQNYFLKSIYNSFSALGTAVILFPTADALYLRIQSNIIGTIIALASYYLFRLLFRRVSEKAGERISESEKQTDQNRESQNS